MHLIGADAQAVGGKVIVDGRKEYRPIWVPDGSLTELIRQHLTGRVLMTFNDKKRNEKLFIHALATRVLRLVDGEWKTAFLCIDFDVKSEEHTRGFDSEQDAHDAAVFVLEVLERAGFNPVLERSQGGRGRHIWVTFAAPIPAGAAWLLGDIARRALGPDGMRLELFPAGSENCGANLPDDPKTNRAGLLIALPFPGRRGHLDGGRFIYPDLKVRPVATVAHAPDELVATVVEGYAAWKAALDSHRGGSRATPLDDSRFVGTEWEQWVGRSCVEVMRTIAPQRITEVCGDVLLCDCPWHDSRSKRSLHVDAKKGWLCRACQNCGVRGSGGGPVQLAMWLLRGPL